MIVEKMTERPVTYVVKKTRDAKERLDAVARGNRTARILALALKQVRTLLKDAVETVLPFVPDPARGARRAQHMLKPRMFRRRIDEPRRLELMNLTEPLKPRGIDKIAFVSRFAGLPIRGRRRNRNITVNGILN